MMSAYELYTNLLLPLDCRPTNSCVVLPLQVSRRGNPSRTRDHTCTPFTTWCYGVRHGRQPLNLSWLPTLASWPLLATMGLVDASTPHWRRPGTCTAPGLRPLLVAPDPLALLWTRPSLRDRTLRALHLRSQATKLAPGLAPLLPFRSKDPCSRTGHPAYNVQVTGTPCCPRAPALLRSRTPCSHHGTLPATIGHWTRPADRLHATSGTGHRHHLKGLALMGGDCPLDP